MEQENQKDLFSLEYYLLKYLAPVLEKKKFILISIALGFMLSFPLLFFIRPEYLSQATVLVEEPRANVLSKVSKNLAVRKADGAYIMAEAEKLRSDAFAREVLKILPEEMKNELKYHLDFKSQLTEGITDATKNVFGKTAVTALKKFLGRNIEEVNINDEIALIAEIQNRISVRSKASRAMIWITGSTLKKEMATLLVQSYLEVWKALNLKDNKEVISKERKIIEIQRRESLTQLKKAEKELIAFKKKYEIPSELRFTPDVSIQLEMDRLYSRLTTAKERFDTTDKIYLDIMRKESSIIINVRIINEPNIPIYPSKNIGSKIVTMGIFFGLSLGLTLVLAIDFIRGTIRHETDLTSVTDIPVLGVLPKL
jgi:uncharacterized protein involved in exopolysaccharide biosynthesis